VTGPDIPRHPDVSGALGTPFPSGETHSGGARTKQWHPTFARLLRPLLEGHYDVKTNFPVGDAPRQADIVLRRRTSQGPLPFRGLWRHLTPWNVLEFKGPTVSPRGEDFDPLVELGLGIHRRLNEERDREGQPWLGPAEVSLWYLANHLGSRLLRQWRGHVGALEGHGPGVWRCVVLRRPVFLVSGDELPVEKDSLPLHLIGKESLETERQLGEFLVGHTALWEEYGGWLAALHPQVWKEVEAMARTEREKFDFDFGPLVETVGLKPLLEAFGLERVVEELGKEELRSRLPPEVRRRLIEQLGGVVPPAAEPPAAPAVHEPGAGPRREKRRK
jgi:hypothetical protein